MFKQGGRGDTGRRGDTGDTGGRGGMGESMRRQGETREAWRIRGSSEDKGNRGGK